MKVPLGISAYRRDDAFGPRIDLLNLLLEKDESGGSPDGFMRVERFGLEAYATIASPAHGVFRQDGVLAGRVISVGGGILFDAAEAIGPVAGTGNASWAPTPGKLAVVRSPNAYLYDGTSIASLLIPDGYLGVDADQLNGYVIIMTTTGRFYWLVPGATVIDALDFATAESSPDGGIAVARLVDELFMFQTDTTEVWQTTGDPDAPFQRAAGRVYDKGCLHKDTVRRFDNALVWVGDDFSIYRTSQVPQDIGSPFLSERLRLRTGDPAAFVFKQDDHEVYVLRIPGQGSFGYDASTQQWSEFGSFGQTEWRPHVGTDIAGGNIVGDATSGKLWRLADRANDDGAEKTRRVSGVVAFNGKPARSNNFSVGIGCAANVDVEIDWRDADEDYPSVPETDLALAPSYVCNIQRTGLLRQPYRQFRVTVRADTKVRISGASFAEAFS